MFKTAWADLESYWALTSRLEERYEKLIRQKIADRVAMGCTDWQVAIDHGLEDAGFGAWWKDGHVIRLTQYEF